MESLAGVILVAVLVVGVILFVKRRNKKDDNDGNGGNGGSGPGGPHPVQPPNDNVSVR